MKNQILLQAITSFLLMLDSKLSRNLKTPICYKELLQYSTAHQQSYTLCTLEIGYYEQRANAWNLQLILLMSLELELRTEIYIFLTSSCSRFCHERSLSFAMSESFIFTLFLRSILHIKTYTQQNAAFNGIEQLTLFFKVHALNLLQRKKCIF